MNQQQDMNREIREELKSIAPGLANLNKPVPGDPPEGYFDSLPDVLVDKLKMEQRGNSRARIFRITIAAAAAIALALILFRPMTNTGSDELQLSDDEIFYYLSSNAADYESNDLYALLDDASTSEIGLMLGQDEMDDLLDALMNDMDDETLDAIFESQNQQYNEEDYQ